MHPIDEPVRAVRPYPRDGPPIRPLIPAPPRIPATDLQTRRRESRRQASLARRRERPGDPDPLKPMR